MDGGYGDGTPAAVIQATAETVNVKFRSVVVFTKMQSIEVGDVEGHIISVYEARGLNSHENGEVAIWTTSGTLDSFEGSKGYGLETYEDGSTHWAKYQSTTKPVQGGKILLYEGTWESIKGTGRFEGVKGSGSFTGKGFPAYGVTYFDVTGSYTLPSQ